MSCIHFSYFGKGKQTIVLFPGWTHPVQKEPKFINELGKKFRIISVELPGYMNNADLSSYQDFLFLAKEFHKELKKTNINPLAFIGFSMGCKLITTYSSLYPSNIRCIFIGCPINSYQLPIWAKLLVKHKFLINLFRRNKKFIQFAVNIAFQNVSQDPKATFKEDRVTLLGAFDSLIGLITSDMKLNKYKNLTTFIYGKNDNYLQEAEKMNLSKLKIISGAGHNCVYDHEIEIVKLINQAIKNIP